MWYTIDTMKSILSYFKETIERGASDLHLVGEELPLVRVHGELTALDDKAISAKELESNIWEMFGVDAKKKFADTLELDVAYDLDGQRFRVNIHQQVGVIALAARAIPTTIPTPDELNFEPALRETVTLMDGLVLVVGPTGHGKSTTLASIIEEINRTKKTHIITIEDPIEFLFDDKESLIEQREVGSDTRSFDEALKHVLRQDPNVILVGEMRDPETITTVLTAAETGHLVFSTLHTSSAAEAIERIVDVFDGAKQKQVLIQLASALRVVVAQQLVPTVDGKRMAVREVLVNTPAVANLIRENAVAQIPSAMQTGAKDGMVTMRQSLEAANKAGLISDDVLERRVGRQRKM